MKKTKIIATISGLKCDTGFIRDLYKHGMNAVRLNTAHQSPEESLKIIKNVREVSEKIAIILDTKGPEIRTTICDSDILLNKGDKISMIGDPKKKSTRDCIYVTYDHFVDEIKIGTPVLIDDGYVELLVIEKKDDHLICQALNPGKIGSRKSVNVPKARFNLPSLNKKDKEFIRFAAEQEIDFIAHSFVRDKKDVQTLQNLLDEYNSDIKIIAKIENQEGVDNIDEILENVYGIMVARGDLAIEIPYAKIPGIQNDLVEKCIVARKPVIIATQMLQSMIDQPRPTRAEVTDIAHAIFSKADAIMLSGETAFGKYPREAVSVMTTVAKETEKSISDMQNTPFAVLSTEISAFLSKSAVEASVTLNAAAILADTRTGQTIRNMAAFRGEKPIYAQCYDKRTMRKLALTYGVYSNYRKPEEYRKFMQHGLNSLVKKGLLNIEEVIVVLGGSLDGNFHDNQGATFIKISQIKTLIKDI